MKWYWLAWPLLTEDVPGAEVLALGPVVRVEGPVDPVGGRVGDAEEEANGEQAAEGKPPRRTAPSLSHRAPCAVSSGAFGDAAEAEGSVWLL